MIFERDYFKINIKYYLKKPLEFKAPLYVYNLISLRLYSFGESLILVVLIISSILSELQLDTCIIFQVILDFYILNLDTMFVKSCAISLIELMFDDTSWKDAVCSSTAEATSCVFDEF